MSSHDPAPHSLAASHQDASLRDLVRAKVGETDVAALSDAIKEIMLSEAIERSNGNLSRASTLLGISRQGVQQMLQRFGLKTWADDLRRRSSAQAELVAARQGVARSASR
jgi:DNA-binding protein Fis